jgi:hypothetical protein
MTNGDGLAASGTAYGPVVPAAAIHRGEELLETNGLWASLVLSVHSALGLWALEGRWRPSLRPVRPLGKTFEIALRQVCRASPMKWRKTVRRGQETSPIIFVDFGPKIAVSSRQTRIKKSGNERGVEIGGPQI